MSEPEVATASPPLPSLGVVNINIGVLGHVDSGKTTLVRALSTKFSTASLDKNPQSKERGITLDLGFSAFVLDQVPEQLKNAGASGAQYTLVDCPGHASLIRTIIGGAQIIDRMILVVDATKGIQTQTAECLVIGEILTDDLVVVLNKVDLFPEDLREDKIKKVEQVVRKALQNTRFKNAPIVPVAANIGGDGKEGVGASAASIEASKTVAMSSNVKEPDASVAASWRQDPSTSIGLDKLVSLIHSTTEMPQRDIAGNLYMAVDHCFPIKGQGTILTGTILQGMISVGQTVELPELRTERKVKTIQMFRKPVDNAFQGDRAAVCLTDLNAKLVERGIVATPGTVPQVTGAIALVRKVRFFTLGCQTDSKIHVTVGHSTTMATVRFFGSNELRELAATAVGKSIPKVDSFDFEKDWSYDESLKAGGKAAGGPVLQWCYLSFDQPVVCPANSMVIGSRLETDMHSNTCRIAFYGRLVSNFDPHPAGPVNTSVGGNILKVFKTKERTGIVDRIHQTQDGLATSVIVRSLFKKETDLSQFLGLSVSHRPKGGEDKVSIEKPGGVIESSFGKSGKVKVEFRQGVDAKPGDIIVLKLKKYMFGGASKTVIQ